ncbi:F-box only protein 33-like [Pecten maximus]|uniref:F-box only protein 33-like n=1 Tax=Pecten maximus TaxID=6579 RepID=UPI001458BFF1|nr:F-box only protein 33-like [Pecten maximus]
MAADPNWAVLPSVTLVEIFSYLSHDDKLRASSVCKRWRSCLFHPNLWQKIYFQLHSSKRMKTKFLADRCGHFVREITIKFCSHNITDVRECGRILEIMKINKNLQQFCLQPSSCHMEWPDNNTVYLFDRYLDSVEGIIRNSRDLRHFSLGCLEELLEHSSTFLSLLGRHSRSLRCLHLASVKEDSEGYRIVELDPKLFHPFTTLQQLSIDYDHLTNQLLESFTFHNKTKLEKLIIHVHGVEADHERITNSSWHCIRSHCPNLQVTLNLIHSFDGVEALLDILQPSLPLTHFRQFFCTHLNTTAICYFATHYRTTLRSIHIIDGLMDGYPVPYTSAAEEDPFVMLAWRCSLLTDFTLIGYEIADEDVIAISRLRGMGLKKLDIPRVCITTVDEPEEDEMWGYPLQINFTAFSEQVSDGLSWNWHPLDDQELPLAVFDADADAERAYMDILLEEQQPISAC